MGQQGEGWDVTLSDGLVPTVQSIWVKPNFQWRVRVMDYSDPLWDDMASMEVSFIKGVAYDLGFTSQDAESYGLVIDSRFTQPPSDFQVRVGLDKMELNVVGTILSILDVINIFNGGDDSVLEVTSVTTHIQFFFLIQIIILRTRKLIVKIHLGTTLSQTMIQRVGNTNVDIQ